MGDYFDKIQKLPPDVKKYFLSNSSMFDLKRSFALFGMDSSKSESIAGDIGLMYVGDLRLGGLPKLIQQKVGADERVSASIAYEINKRIFNKFPEYFKDSNALLEEWGRMKSAPIMSEDEAWQKVLEIEPWIAELDQEKKEESEAGRKKEEERRAAMVRIKLQEALKKFEKLGEQYLSANPIKLKIFDAPVRPSIKNWISDYYEKVDARKHDSIERGNYLFHSENARRLTTGERQKVGTMLKALDEDGVVTVDQGKQELIFQGETLEPENTNHKEQITNKTQNTSTSQNTNNHGGVSFSSGHKFPYEQKTNAQAPAEQRQPLRPAMNRPQYDNLGFTPPRRQDSRPSNNVVDLRND